MPPAERRPKEGVSRMEPQKMAVLGSGRAGHALGVGLAKHGHHVMLGSRDPSSDRAKRWLADVGEGGTAGTYADAAAWADWVFMCVPGTAVEATMLMLGGGALDGKIVVDVTNAMTTVDADHITLTWGTDDSVAQHIQRQAPRARVVKAFNTTGTSSMIDPHVPCAPPDMPICGDDAEAKAAVSELLRDVGWEPLDLGTIHSAPMIEAMTLAWVQYGRTKGIWGHCYKFVHP
jgi:8-hydroxy-5-deazaflavin:NADPH oxidoreductase